MNLKLLLLSMILSEKEPHHRFSGSCEVFLVIPICQPNRSIVDFE